MGRTIYEVAKKVNVSISTVSRVLNNSGYVSQATRDKVIAASEELGYRQNRIARSLRSQKSDFIGLIVPDIANEFFSSLASIIEKTVHHHGYSLFLCNTTENQEIENRYIESLMGNQVSGIIIISAGLKPIPSLFKEGIPIVSVDRLGPELQQPHSVNIESDNENGGRLAAEALLKRGAKRFLYIGDQRNMRAMNHRRKGFSETLFQNGVLDSNYQDALVAVSPAISREKVKEIYAKYQFDGLFCGTDLLAIGAMKGLNDLGLMIPDDVQLIGFDGIQLGAFTIPSLSTIRQDIPQLGRISSESVIGLIKGETVSHNVIVPVEMIARGSTKRLTKMTNLTQ